MSQQSPPCQQWYTEPQGAFVLERELKLVQRMLSPWPRRGHSLLEVGCGCGGFLEFFWESGFDVTGLAPSLEHMKLTRQHMHGKADLQIGALDHLPYEDNTFDYVAVMAPPSLEEGPAPHLMLREAVRVAAKGVVLRLWNPFSLSGLCLRWRRQSLPLHVHEGLWLSWRHARALLHTLSPGGNVSTGSTLLGPPASWHDTPLCQKLNDLMIPLPLGSVMMLRLTHAAARPLTGLPLRIKLRMQESGPAAVLERQQRSSGTMANTGECSREIPPRP